MSGKSNKVKAAPVVAAPQQTPPVENDAETPAPDTVPAPAPQTDPYVPSPRRVSQE
jgi:hypothetical protein